MFLRSARGDTPGLQFNRRDRMSILSTPLPNGWTIPLKVSLFGTQFPTAHTIPSAAFVHVRQTLVMARWTNLESVPNGAVNCFLNLSFNSRKSRNECSNASDLAQRISHRNRLWRKSICCAFGICNKIATISSFSNCQRQNKVRSTLANSGGVAVRSFDWRNNVYIY